MRENKNVVFREVLKFRIQAKCSKKTRVYRAFILNITLPVLKSYDILPSLSRRGFFTDSNVIALIISFKLVIIIITKEKVEDQVNTCLWSIFRNISDIDIDCMAEVFNLKVYNIKS